MFPASSKKKQQRTHEFAVVGLTFVGGYPDNIHTIAQHPDAADGGEGLATVVVRNPDNAYDANAIEVHVPSVGMIGHVPRQIAAVVAPELDSGQQYLVRCWPRIDPAHQDQPGVTVRMIPAGRAA